MSTIKSLNRREFLSLTGRSGGVLMLGSALGMSSQHSNAQEWSLAPAEKTVETSGQLGTFVTIHDNGDVDIICHRAEMGQGILTSVPQIIAEEMGADWSRVNAILGDADEKYGNQSTGGSASIRRYHDHIRQMGAVAKDLLAQAAANKWKISKDEIKVDKHWVLSIDRGQSATFGDLAAEASALPVPDLQELSFKAKSDYTIVGKDVPLQGLEDIVTGQAVYAQDVMLPGLLIASIERPPVVGGKVKSFDATQAKKVKGVVDVIQLRDRGYPVHLKPVSGVAVLAENSWAAIEGRKKLTVEWEHGANQTHNSQAYAQELVQKVQTQGEIVRAEGDVYKRRFKKKRTVEATYTIPYHHHMSMETPAATAVIEGDKVTIWSGTQNPQGGKTLALEELGLDAEKDSDKVQLKQTLMGGAFGRKGKNDYTLEAVELAKATGKPVKVIWSREDDVKHGFYHSTSANYLKAELTKDKQGSNYWIQRVVAPPIAWIFDHETTRLQDGDMSLGFVDIPFAIKHLSCETPEVTTHIRTGWFRAVGNINNAFALGSFVDELAAKAEISTQQMWLNLLGEDRDFDPRTQGFEAYSFYGQTKEDDDIDDYLIAISRYKRVLNEVVSKSGADQLTAENEGWGISVAASFNSYAAAATKVKVVDNKVQVLEMHTAIDCGLVVTPDRVASQMEGAMIMALSMTLESEITVKNGAVVQNNFYDYPVTRMDQVPDLYVHIVNSDEAPGGVGEPGLPPVLPSITNAIFHASGVRIRDLPVKKTMSV